MVRSSPSYHKTHQCNLVLLKDLVVHEVLLDLQPKIPLEVNGFRKLKPFVISSYSFEKFQSKTICLTHLNSRLNLRIGSQILWLLCDQWSYCLSWWELGIVFSHFNRR